MRVCLYDYRHYIASERACVALIRRTLWPDGIRCPRCQDGRTWAMRERGGVRYRCKACRHHFSDTSGTIFEARRTPLLKWLLAIGLWKHGISASALRDALGVTYKTAWGVLRTMRRAIGSERCFEALRGNVEVDETYYGGAPEGKAGPRRRREGSGRGVAPAQRVHQDPRRALPGGPHPAGDHPTRRPPGEHDLSRWPLESRGPGGRRLLARGHRTHRRLRALAQRTHSGDREPVGPY
jgi:transposase-like protein